MRRMLSIAAAATLATASAFAQTPPVQNRTEIPAPNEGQAGDRVVAGQHGGRSGTGEVGNRPVAGRSVPETQVGQVGQVAGQNAAAQGQIRTGVGRLPAAGVIRSEVNDALFAAAAADSGLAEVTLSQLGVQQASDPELKQFSQRMIEEHTRMNGELRTLTAQKGIRIPEMVDVRSQFCAQSLAGLSGEEFDRCYAKAQLVAHMDAVEMFTAEAERGVDPDVKALAAKALPHIKDHLHQIKPIAQKYKKEMEKEGGSERGRIGNPGGPPIR